MAYEQLQERVCRANLGLVEAGLVVLTWGNASAVDRAADVMAIKPSGVPYSQLRPEHVVVLSLETGQTVRGTARPSSDTPTHLYLYRCFHSLGGVVHTHSCYATSFAQARRPIPCLGTTHADAFPGPVPLTRALTRKEIEGDYELNTGKVIVECLRKRVPKHNPNHVPGAGVLVWGHGPFSFGATVEEALENAVTLEEVARMAYQTLGINPRSAPLPRVLHDKHFGRKHGPRAYYGQQTPQ
jgi:L-ribulose-5-phosphate 4-epimerase